MVGSLPAKDQEALDGKVVEWMQKVSDEEYEAA